MNPNPVDPIHYAWARCNKGVSLPVSLRLKNAGASPLASSLASAWRLPTVPLVSPEQAAIRAAAHSRIFGRIRPY